MFEKDSGVIFISENEQNKNDAIDDSIKQSSTIVMEDDDISIDLDEI